MKPPKAKAAAARPEASQLRPRTPEESEHAGGRHQLHRHLVDHPGQGAGQDGEEDGGGVGGPGVEARPGGGSRTRG